MSLELGFVVLEKFWCGQADLGHFVDVVRAASPQDLSSGAGELAGEIPEGGEVFRVVPVGVGPVTEAFGPEFEAGKQAVDVRHLESLLEELGVLAPHVVQGGQEERRDAQRSVPTVASPLAALPTQLSQRRHHDDSFNRRPGRRSESSLLIISRIS